MGKNRGEPAISLDEQVDFEKLPGCHSRLQEDLGPKVTKMHWLILRNNPVEVRDFTIILYFKLQR